MSSLRFTPAIPAVAAYAELFETTGWNRTYAATLPELKSALENSWLVHSAYVGEVLVGVGRVVSDGVLYAMLYDVIVHPDFRMQGIGGALVQRLVRFCLAAGIRDIQLFAAAGTQPFYHACGFRERPAEAPGMVWRGSMES